MLGQLKGSDFIRQFSNTAAGTRSQNRGSESWSRPFSREARTEAEAQEIIFRHRSGI